MKKTSIILFASIMLFGIVSCKKGNTEQEQSQQQDSLSNVESEQQKSSVAPLDPRSRIYYQGDFDREYSYIVISKKDLTLSVYADLDDGTVLVARYPVCLSKNKGQKSENGDMKTPESEPNEPFTITEIKDASTWCHDFGDGRGEIPAYGAWFLRLSFGSGIGIHGSTNNEWSIPGSKMKAPKGKTVGRDSEGCIRLGDDEICHLHDNYAFVGQKVIIKKEDQGALPFEKNLENKDDEGKLLVFK